MVEVVEGDRFHGARLLIQRLVFLGLQVILGRLPQFPFPLQRMPHVGGGSVFFSCAQRVPPLSAQLLQHVDRDVRIASFQPLNGQVDLGIGVRHSRPHEACEILDAWHLALMDVDRVVASGDPPDVNLLDELRLTAHCLLCLTEMARRYWHGELRRAF